MIPSLNVNQSEKTAQDGQASSTAKSGASGGSRGIVNNFAFPGSNLTAETGNGGGIPPYVWGIVAAGAFLVFYLWHKKG
jgi:hypothetical protein